MTEIRFYHLLSKTTEEALPQLVAKASERQWRVLILARKEGMLKSVSLKLWGYKPESFLAHGFEGAVPVKSIADQPVWLTTDQSNPNKSTVAFALEGTEIEKPEQFDLICDVFDGKDSFMVEQARERWKIYKKQGLTITYWQQTPDGWQKKSG